MRECVFDRERDEQTFVFAWETRRTGEGVGLEYISSFLLLIVGVQVAVELNAFWTNKVMADVVSLLSDVMSPNLVRVGCEGE